MAKTKSTKKSKEKKKEAAAPEAAKPKPLIEIIPLDQQEGLGGNVPSLINDVPKDVLEQARDLVIEWGITGSQAIWRMCCLLIMQNRKNYMEPLAVDNMAYMGQVVARCAASHASQCRFL